MHLQKPDHVRLCPTPAPLDRQAHELNAAVASSRLYYVILLVLSPPLSGQEKESTATVDGSGSTHINNITPSGAQLSCGKPERYRKEAIQAPNAQAADVGGKLGVIGLAD